MSDESPGATIRRARQKSRMKQRELADRMGVHETTVSYWERDKFFPERHWAALNELLHINLTPPGSAVPAAADPLAEELGQDAAVRLRRELARRGEAGRVVLAEMERVLSSPAEEELSGPDRAVS